jgi:N-methylhydantoinase A/oxoprolinase/acetone carboxylase beta subunit
MSDSLYQMLELGNIAPEEVILIAHSTTQATNALLEGDVALVGIVGMGGGLEMRQARRQTDIGAIELAPGRFLQTRHRFLDTNNGLDEDAARRAIEQLRAEKVEVIVTSEAFSVERPENESRVAELAREAGLPATAAHEISQLLGLRMRTRTAVINASMLPKMMETANMTEESVRKAGIKAPLMIMRSDGGIMDIEQMRRRPILTMLSGPAAGVAAALMYARITDGIFLEVGGTSTDISAIRNGKSLVKSATVGGFQLAVRTLDVRTLGIAGGSVPRIHNGRVVDVGPRSAHIAQLGYSAFEPFQEGPITLRHIAPKKDDPEDYVRLESSDGKAFTVTPTCASNYLDLVPADCPAAGDRARIEQALGATAEALGNVTKQQAAEMILDRSFPKVANVVEDLILDYELDRNLLTLSGGGGGAWAIVPYTAKKMGLPHEIAPNAPMISAIGAALALVRDTVEKTIIDPTESDILRIRKEAEEAVVRMGASPETVEVQVEIDPQKNILRAMATGATELRSRDLSKRVLTSDEIEEQVRKSIRESILELRQLGDIGGLLIFEAQTQQPRWFGLRHERRTQVRVIDREGIIRLQLSRGDGLVCPRAQAVTRLRPFVLERTAYGDAGKALPDVFVVYRGRVLDLTGLQSFDQIQTLMNVELDRLPPEETIAALVKTGQA